VGAVGALVTASRALEAARPPWLAHPPGSLLVAASDSPADQKRLAQIVCRGHDDQAQIEAALAEVAEGGSVTLASGHYYLSEPLALVRGGSKLSGVYPISSRAAVGGPSAPDQGMMAVLTPAPGRSLPCLICLVPAQPSVGLEISNLYLLGTSPEGVLLDGAALGQAISNVSIAGILAYQGAVGIQVAGSHSSVENCIVRGARAYGMRLSGPYLKVVNNQVTNIGGDGIDTDGAANLISGNVVVDTFGGIAMGNNFEGEKPPFSTVPSSHSGTMIQSNYIKGTRGSALVVNSDPTGRIKPETSSVTLSQNSVYVDSSVLRGPAVDVDCATNVLITNNLIDLSGPTSPYSAIGVTDSSAVLVIGNTIAGRWRGGPVLGQAVSGLVSINNKTVIDSSTTLAGDLTGLLNGSTLGLD
jgi:hypothetical protein